MYDMIFINNLPAFYKINLYNEIAKQKKILVIFITNASKDRNKDFYNGQMNFEHRYLSDDIYESRTALKNIIQLIKILFSVKYKKIIIGGWDSLENWIVWLLSRKNQNCVVVESSDIESKPTGVKGLLKKIFLNRVSIGYASGESQKKLLLNCGFKGKIIKTKGVGIFDYNKVKFEKPMPKVVKNFLYVGRLSPEKNLEQLIRVFNDLKDLKLNIAGFGPQEKYLKSISKENISFLGAIKNSELSLVYQKNDVFILPSLSETWGLVVEEALYNGVPVILSDKVGCALEVIRNGEEGLIFECGNDNDLKNKINIFRSIENYNNFKDNVNKLDFIKIREEQVKAYIGDY